MTDRLLKQMIKLNIIESENLEIYRFGLESMILKLIHYTTYLFIAFLFRETMRFLTFFVAFLLLRKNAGGYHAKTKKGCYVCSSITVLSVVIGMKMFPEWDAVVIIGVYLVLAGDMLICMMSPLGNKNRKLSEEETKFFHKRSISFLIIENVFFCFLIICGKELYAIPIGMAIICEAILLLLEKIFHDS